MDREQKVTAPKISRIPAKGLAISFGSVVSAAALAACGGAEKTGGVGQAANEPGGGVTVSATRELVNPVTLEAASPTSVPEAIPTIVPEATPTEEVKPTPTFEQAVQMITEAYGGRTFPTLTYPEFQTSEGVTQFLKKCLSNGQTISTGSLVFEPGTPNYRTALLGGCTRAMEATKELYLLTGEKSAQEANQGVFRILESVFNSVKDQSPAAGQDYLDVVKARYSAITPPAK